MRAHRQMLLTLPSHSVHQLPFQREVAATNGSRRSVSIPGA